MPRRPKIKITCIDRKGPCMCHRGVRVGDSWDFDKDRGKMCPMVQHVGFPYIDILRYGGEIPQPGQPKGTAIFCCPDVDSIMVFKVERIDDGKKETPSEEQENGKN